MRSTNSSYNLSAKVFNALAHPSRLEILDLLRDGEACVCHIQAMLDLRQAYISQHLNVLRHAGLVSSRKDGQRVYYHISDDYLFAIVDGARTYLQLSGRWQPEFVNKDHPSRPCICPACTENQVQIQREASHA